MKVQNIIVLNIIHSAYKEHIPNSLISTVKMSYKPFKVREERK